MPAPYNLQFMGETYYYTSDVPGTYARVNFSSLGYLDQATYQQRDLTGAGMVYVDSDNPGWYRIGNLYSGCIHCDLYGKGFQMWDGAS